jgi:hypothetical protein
MRKTALGFLVCWAIPALSYDLYAIPRINDLLLVDSDSQIVTILGASEVLSMGPGVFSMLDDITGLSLILSDQTGISRIKPIDAIGPVTSGLLRAQAGQPKAFVQLILGPLSFAYAKFMNDAVLVDNGSQVRFIFDKPDILHSAPMPTIEQLRVVDR